MAKPPAEVRFPGDRNRRKKVRVRGIKQASKEIQRRLEANLEGLLDDPESFVPEITGELGKISFFGHKDKMAMTLKEIEIVAAKRNDHRWLKKRMVKKGGDEVCRALAGSLLAAGEEDLSTVSVFKHPLYGTSSYLRRGNGKQSHLAGIQNFNHPRLRLLVWDGHAKAGQYFFSWDGGFVCSCSTPDAPSDWISWVLDKSSVELKGEGVRWTSGLTEEVVENDELTESGWLLLTFQDSTKVGISPASLAKTEVPFAQSLAISMMPPNKLGSICEAQWMWRPKGWPEDMALPDEGIERLGEVLDSWLRMSLDDARLSESCRSSILNSIEEGYVVGTSWFGDDDREGFLDCLSGTDDEKSAISVILDSLTKGIHVRSDGVVLDLDTEVVRMEESSCHPNLVSLWPKYGKTVLQGLFGLSDEASIEILERQSRRKQGFGAFLRELTESLDTEMRLSRLPWENEELPEPLRMADSLVRKAVGEGVSSTVSLARKGKGLDSSMGWAWLVVHNRTESDAWRFDETVRDKGGDWVPALQALWDAAEDLLLNDIEEAEEDYTNAMKWLAESSGVSEFY
ncbi:MAG: hypothetical protein CMA71_04845 [Euryarchaeota archaeon]|jgi:hypothetical protein|nr:hypothetical protein [Euryarchaeota archaeon]MBP12845.1 hypothetical protein [Euryarchaeota archaeon]|tara:strand:+ start:927 stop:2636 length:1710 start_codon:yes stop_codon:yes gene_type:complete